MIEDKQQKELEKEGQKKGINASDTKEAVPLEQLQDQCLYCCIFVLIFKQMGGKRTNLQMYLSIFMSNTPNNNNNNTTITLKLSIYPDPYLFSSSSTHGYMV